MFDSLDMQNSEQLKKKLYEFFFTQPKQLRKETSYKLGKLNTGESEGRSFKDDETLSDIEEKKKRH